MFENLTKKEQDLRTAHWEKPITHCTVGAVVYRSNVRGTPTFRDLEFLLTTRASGTPECRGFTQTHLPGYVNPTDDTPAKAMQRVLKDKLGSSLPLEKIGFAGLIGPALWKSTAAINDDNLVVTVLDEQAEKVSPFQMTVFGADYSDYVLGTLDSSIKCPRWVRFKDLIEQKGADKTCIYWSIFYLWGKSFLRELDREDVTRVWGPGTYRFHL